MTHLSSPMWHTACSECGSPASTRAGKHHFCLRCSAIRNCASCDKQLPRYLMTSVEGERFCSGCCHVRTEYES